MLEQELIERGLFNNENALKQIRTLDPQTNSRKTQNQQEIIKILFKTEIVLLCFVM
jgi:hypothetical protein